MNSIEKKITEEFYFESAKSYKIWIRILKSRLGTIYRIWRKICFFAYTVKYHTKRHYHLHLVFQNEEKIWRAQSVFSTQDRATRKDGIEDLYGSVSRRLIPLYKKIENTIPHKNFDSRTFRGQFAMLTRMHRGLSRKQLCLLLNSHADLYNFGRRHPSLWLHFPFSPSFIEQFEERTSTIPEEITQGFLFGAGFPTEFFSNWIAQICCAENEFQEFKKWYSSYELRKINQ